MRAPLWIISNILIISQGERNIVGLFPEFNEKKTIKNVRNFFNNDKKYQRICRNAWNDGIKAQVNDVTGIHGSRKGNGSEKMMIYYAECARAKKAVENANTVWSVASQDILTTLYDKLLTVVETKLHINHHLGHSTFKDADEVACLEFAEACDRISMQMNCNLKILPLFLNFEDDNEKAGTKQEQNGNKTGTK